MELISREEAMEAIRAIKEVILINAEVINALYHVPTIESRPKGKWIITRGCEEVIVTCSNCGAKDYIPTTIDGRFYFSRNYCWDCGAEMRGEE